MAYCYSGDTTGLNPVSIQFITNFIPQIDITYNACSDIINSGWTYYHTVVAGVQNVGWCNYVGLNGGVQMDKVSTCEWSETNPNYSYKNGDCVYDIFSDAGCTQWTGVNMVIDANGHGQTALNALQKGTYYVRESESQHGTNYL